MNENSIVLIMCELYKPTLMYLVVMLFPLLLLKILFLSDVVAVKSSIVMTFILSVIMYVGFGYIEWKVGVLSDLMALPYYNDAMLEILYHKISTIILILYGITPIIMIIFAALMALKYKVHWTLCIFLSLIMGVAGLYSIYIFSKSKT